MDVRPAVKSVSISRYMVYPLGVSKGCVLRVSTHRGGLTVCPGGGFKGWFQEAC